MKRDFPGKCTIHRTVDAGPCARHRTAAGGRAKLRKARESRAFSFSTIVVLVCLAWSCSPPDKKTPQSAFARLAPCLEKKAPECVFGEMNRDSRWSIHTIFRTLGEIRQVATKSYPPESLDDAFGPWKEEAQAKSPEDLFRIYCNKRNCLVPLLEGFGAVTQTTPLSDTISRVETTRGKNFELMKSETNWGIAIYNDGLQQAKIRLLDRLAQVRKNAQEFEEQKLATSANDGSPTPEVVTP